MLLYPNTGAQYATQFQVLLNALLPPLVRELSFDVPETFRRLEYRESIIAVMVQYWRGGWSYLQYCGQPVSGVFCW